jgi:hypothetical protein
MRPFPKSIGAFKMRNIQDLRKGVLKLTLDLTAVQTTATHADAAAALLQHVAVSPSRGQLFTNEEQQQISRTLMVLAAAESRMTALKYTRERQFEEEFLPDEPPAMVDEQPMQTFGVMGIRDNTPPSFFPRTSFLNPTGGESL